MPGRTFEVLLLSGIAGLVLLVCGILSGGVFVSSMIERSAPADGISDISARKMSPRR
jgi:hypothetical protein